MRAEFDGLETAETFEHFSEISEISHVVVSKLFLSGKVISMATLVER